MDLGFCRGMISRVSTRSSRKIKSLAFEILLLSDWRAGMRHGRSQDTKQIGFAALKNLERHEGQTSRYQGTLMTTIRWFPRSKRSAFKTEARLLCNRW